MASCAVYQADALAWLANPANGAGPNGGIVTSLPDMGDLGMDWATYVPWFKDAAQHVMAAVWAAQPVVFFQTDRKQGGVWHSKAQLLHQVAAETGLRCLWHKVVLRRAVGATDLHRPTYSHLLAYSATGKPGPAWGDVVAPSPSLYRDGMPTLAALLAAQHLARSCTSLLDPFCGYGTTLAAAMALGMGAVGVDLDAGMVARARAVAPLQLPL